MQGTMVVMHTDGTTVKEDLTSPPDYKTLQKQVGGYIELVPYFTTYEGHNCVVFCNEEGKIHELPQNYAATDAWWKCFPTSDYLVGNVVVIYGDKELMNAL